MTNPPQPIGATPPSRRGGLPAWARELIALYESHAFSQFLLFGNVHDRIVAPSDAGAEIRSLQDFVLRVLLPRFDVVLSYDLGHGIRVEKGCALFQEWPRMRERPDLPKTPRAAVETLSHYFRYAANLARLRGKSPQVGCVVGAADLVAPAVPGGLSYDLNALALLLRDWSWDERLGEIPLATFLISENLNELHPLLVNNPRAARLCVPLPSQHELETALGLFSSRFPTALSRYSEDLPRLAAQLSGATLSSLQGLLKTKEYRDEPLHASDLAALKRELVERDCAGLIEFVEPDRTLDHYHGHDAVVRWLRKDLALWRRGDLEAMPMGYLLCGPVGTGKTFLVECLAGEAGVPVVKLRNFRDRWVGSTEGNLERIFRLLHALGRCFVFIDEADQALGRRTVESGDSGVSGRVYSMMADEMGDTRNRGRIVWVLASSRPDLIEVDLKRPGRVDVRIPLFPTVDPAEGFALIRALCRARGIDIPESAFAELAPRVPRLLTPGAAEALAVKVYRAIRTDDLAPVDALSATLVDTQSPIAPDVMDFQIRLARREASDLELVPAFFRSYGQDGGDGAGSDADAEASTTLPS